MKKYISVVLVSFLFVLIDSCSTKEVEINELTTSASPAEGGSVSPSEGSYTSGEEVFVTARPSSGYEFKNWSGSITGTANPIEITMNTDKEVVAVFEMLDADNDGVADDLDKCPDTSQGESVDENGCTDGQKDGDGDGVDDATDQCPETPEGEFVGEDGCSDSQKDTDGDGITDDLDKCQNTPDGEAVDATGCSENQVDTDGDTLTDDLDQCPDTPDGEAIDEQGCSQSQKDDDSDGVNNLLDECPDTPDGEAVDEKGCSSSQEDTDGDGVTDNDDQCPATPDGETVDDKGCSESQRDSDADGVSDDLDQCPETPNGEVVDAQGCSTSQTDSDGDGVFDDVDDCPGTPDGETVDEKGCSDGQNDTQAPNITSIEVTEITATSFKVDWRLDEGSKGYVRFGTSPGVYVASTGIENDFLTRHIQPVGGDNPFPLNQETTYYWQIYVEDQYGNTAFSDEQTTTTSEEVLKTYVPDDQFEQNLIEQGLDDVLDDYVLTENIEIVVVLELYADFDDTGRSHEPILDYTGLEDFASLQELTLSSMAESLTSDSIDLSRNPNLKKLVFYQTEFNGIDLSGNQMLEEIRFLGSDEGGFFECRISDLDLRSNMNIKKLSLSFVNYIDNLNLILERAPSIEEFQYAEYDGSSENSIVGLSFINNPNLRTLLFGGDCLTLEFINLKNGANLQLESLAITPACHFSSTGGICIEADNPTYISSITTSEDSNGPIDITVTEDCGS